MLKRRNTFRALKSLIPDQFVRFLRRLQDCYQWDEHAQKSWSQEGEDRILQRIFERKQTGFYVDVGAHHPKRFSNTYLFYRRGWRGINIDAMPDSMAEFRKYRPRDINVEMGIGEKEGEFPYYIFNEPAFNGFSMELSRSRDSRENNYKIIKRIPVKVLPLAIMFERYLQPEQEIDFLSVDVEGFDLAVLKSNDWTRHRPSYVLAEIISGGTHSLEEDPVVLFMRDQAYGVYAKCMNTVFFSKQS